MIYKFIPIYEVLEKVYRDSGSADELPFDDLVVFASEALDKIGAHQQYWRKVTGDKENPEMDITDYKAKLPCDLFKIEQVSVNGCAARYAGNSFHYLMNGDCCTLVANDSQGEWIVPLEDNFSKSFSPVSANRGIVPPELQEYTYTVNDNFITLNVKSGKVCIAYIAHPTDKDGYPLIPDEDIYKEAITKYITMKLDYIDWRRGKIPADVFKHSEREWMWYSAAAYAKAITPSIDQMENLKSQWSRLVPNIKRHQTFFK